LSVAVAGHGASEALAEECRQAGCVFLGAVDSAMETLQGGRVLANPVFGGSGVYVKVLEMLTAERPIVSTSDGLCGLSAAVRRAVTVADTPQAFADELVAALGRRVDSVAVASCLADYTPEAFAEKFAGLFKTAATRT
jgi:hypothetical protein